MQIIVIKSLITKFLFNFVAVNIIIRLLQIMHNYTCTCKYKQKVQANSFTNDIANLPITSYLEFIISITFGLKNLF